jgi:4-amino-4-deoxy-L-arabinose transferase-like glycosyltransferase
VTAPTRRQRWLRRAIGILLALHAFAIVLANQDDVGLSRDETTYMAVGERYAGWWLDLVTFTDGVTAEKRITATWGGKPGGANNTEHPPLVKTIMGLSERILHRGLGWTDRVTAHRVPGAAFYALLVGLVFAMVLAVWGLPEAVVAALLVTFMPRGVFHASLANFDVPITAMWFATIYAYWRGLASRWWAIGAGVAFGLALATKHNAVLLPFALVVHYAWVALRSQRLERRERLAGLRELPRARRIGPWLAATGAALGRGIARMRPSMLVALAVLGPLVLYAVWPYLWLDPFGNVAEWIGFHTRHVHYNFEYLGDNWNAPPFPWHVPLVTTLFTLPVVTLAAGVIGAGVLLVRARRGESADADRAPALLLFLSAGASMGPFLLGSTPIFGAEKHWMPAFPTICVFAGVGAIWAARVAIRAVGKRAAWVEARRSRLLCPATCAVVGLAVVAAAATETHHAQPYALTHYNALAGGAPGGADLGMNRQFWGIAARGVLPYLAAHAPAKGQPAASVYSHDASMQWADYRRMGLLPATLPDAGHENVGVVASKWAIVIHELHFNRHDYMIWDAYGTVQPVFVLRTDGVPIVSVYRRP